jgi:Carboxypeptidase regulatory-like domain
VKSAISNQPIANAEITVDNGDGGRVNTDSNGVFEANVIADQPHTLTISKSGYTSVTYYNVRVGNDKTVYVETILQIPEEYANKTGTATG